MKKVLKKIGIGILIIMCIIAIIQLIIEGPTKKEEVKEVKQIEEKVVTEVKSEEVKTEITKIAEFADEKGNFVIINTFMGTEEDIRAHGEKAFNREGQTTWSYYFDVIEEKKAKEIEFMKSFTDVQEYISSLEEKPTYTAVISYSGKYIFTK